jgi:two-component system phosphate regulon sensor histidine kinase PhoR
LLVVALWLPPVVERYQIQSLEYQLAAQARLVGRLAAPLLDGANFSSNQRDDRLQTVTRQVGREIAARVTIIDGRGRVLADSVGDPASMDDHADRPEVREALRSGVGRSARYSRTLRADQLYVAVPVEGSGAGGVVCGVPRPGLHHHHSPLTPRHSPAGVVRLSVSLAEVHRYGARLQGSLLLGLGAAALIAVGLSLLFARSLTQPLQMLRDVAVGLARGDMSRRALLRSRDEIGELARTFDGMATRLEETIAEMGRDRGQMRTVLDTMADGLLVTDADGRVRLLNPAAASLLGVDPATAAGKTVLDITLDAPLQSLVDDVLRTGATASLERALRTPAERTVMVSAAPIQAMHDRDRGGATPGPPVGAVLVFHDLTVARRVERMRRDFVANASHELRTPLASMRVMVETLLGGASEDPEAAQRFLQILNHELQRMTNLVNDLLVLSRLDAPVEAVTQERVALAPLIAELKIGWQAVAQERGVGLGVSVPEELAVRGEKDGVRQILANLVDNALKYTPAGQIRVSARREGSSALLEVSDTGIGIPPTDRERIFERFYRVDKDRSRAVGGTGLGLSIVKHLVQAYGGSISVESRLNRGSMFRVRLRLEEETGTARMGAVTHPMSSIIQETERTVP